MVKAYISGGITGVDDYMERFDKAQTRLENLGLDVINPARILSYMPKSTTYSEYMKLCLEFMNQSDVCLFLDGWKDSRGACFEHEYAKIIGLPRMYES